MTALIVAFVVWLTVTGPAAVAIGHCIDGRNLRDGLPL